MNEKETAELLEAIIVDLKTNVAELKKTNSQLMGNLCKALSLLEKAEAARPTAHDVAQGLIHSQEPRTESLWEKDDKGRIIGRFKPYEEMDLEDERDE